ncbi:ATP-binding cassette sub-family G member 1 isoform X1 [Cydia pomonella]|uniref:ATP-binding cassette sub-family G member 1 isoform X1 n=2 Tax=Cydia pomonella TaxID=82600 RepID=UPI002ADE740D|nr:ATP-binding cassette sub-family G member 1 isoform X1 [Cydia pomonella]
MAVASAMLKGLGNMITGGERERAPPADMPSSVDIQFTNLTLTVTEGFRKRRTKTILKNISGLFRSGQLTAIMGPSGAGKSSLMNALTGFSMEGVTGTIRAGNNICQLGTHQRSLRALKHYRSKSAYILQDDRISPLFTVEELMKFAADMKLGNMTDKLKLTVISEVLEDLGLSGTEKTRCGNLSGGQRKRLSIALELLDNPPVLFLDEPTTGLDSVTSAQCIEMLKNLARSGRTVVCTIHQPTASVYSLFDQVYILADGMCVYHGASENTVPYLAGVGLQCPKYHNPADYMLEIATGEYGSFNELLAVECNKMDWTRAPTPTPSKADQLCKTAVSAAVTPPPEWYRLGVLFRRCFIQQYRDWTVTHLKVLLHIVVGVLLGLLFDGSGNDGAKTFSNLGYLMISIVYLMYTSLMPGILKFPAELSIIKKETFNNWYQLKTYYVALLVTGVPIQIWYSFVYSAPSYFLTEQPQDLSRFAMFVLVLSLITLLADALGNLIGTFLNPINGTFCGAIYSCMMLVLAGYLVLLSHMSWFMRLLSNMSFIRYAFEAIILCIYSFNRPALPCPEYQDYCHMKHPKEVIKQFSYKPDNFWVDIALLFLTTVFFRVVAYFTLRRSVKRSG